MNDKKLLKALIAKFGHNRVMSHGHTYKESAVAKQFFSEDDAQNQTSKEQKLEKDIYDSIVTDAFKAVSVTKDHIYIVVE